MEDLSQKNILATFHSSDELAGATTSCMVSEFLQQIPVEEFCCNISAALDNPSFETKQKIAAPGGGAS
jgi:hypothetical protein